MAFSAILRRSANKAAPLVSYLIGTQRNFLSSAAVVSAVKGASFSPQFLRSAACYPIRQFCSSVDTIPSSSSSKLPGVLQSEINVVEESEEHDKRTRGAEIRRFFYMKIAVEKIIGKFRGHRVRMRRRSKTEWFRRERLWRRSKAEWFRRLKTKNECRLLLKDRFLQKLHSSMFNQQPLARKFRN